MSAGTIALDSGVVVTEAHMDEFHDVLSLLDAIGERIEFRADVDASDSLHSTLRLVGIAQAKINAMLDAARRLTA